MSRFVLLRTVQVAYYVAGWLLDDEASSTNEILMRGSVQLKLAPGHRIG
jgi:hypothetical protein